MTEFGKIYAGNVWGYGSGHGSLPSVTKKYRRLVEDLIVENNIRSVLDFGCGDWQFSRLIDWHGARYTGVDVVDEVIERNTGEFASDTVEFRAIEPSTMILPPADLLIAKDVLQHLTNVQVSMFLNQVLPLYKFALITNCVTPKIHVNREISAGNFRPLDLRKPPFDIKAEEVLRFSGPIMFSWRKCKFFRNWTKVSLLIRI